ncbi:MAG: phosphoenolpyruvate-protein phosphotransferase [Phycisphaeraceae bacterium]|nr:MAG: phosphoenolpyruvate-protein phosphotransferase [Phycisphaeraceae bacterium]
MQVLQGIPVSSGVVIGRITVLDDVASPRVPRRPIRPDAADAEVERFEAARAASIEELNLLHREAQEEMGDEAAKIFLFHIGALADARSVSDPISAMIRDELVTAEHATWRVFHELAKRFAAKRDSTFQTKVSDLMDLQSRVIRHLVGSRIGQPRRLERDTVIVARDLTPSQTAAFDRDRIVAFATDLGGRTSHTAIIARALGLPAVVGCHALLSAAEEGQTVIVDGTLGAVILDPDDETIEKYRSLDVAARARLELLAELADEPAVTIDGTEVELLGNIEFPDELTKVLAAGGTGVGLYRTEFLYLTSDRPPTEDDHYAAYAECVQLAAGRPLTIRTMDLGADKYTQRQAETPERNPFLGLRSIRYCLQNLPMFKAQLRAILRASAHGPIRVMFPLVTSVAEFRRARMILRDAMEDLDELGQPYDREMPVGMMVEVPSVALMAPTFAREADFFSIGTNDLVQYTLAVDRTNERVASLYVPTHPAVLKLIRDVVRASNRYEIPTSCCGEAAGDLEFAPLLLGLGVRTLSVTPSGIPQLKRLIRALSLSDCERIAKKAISFDSETEAADYVRDHLRKLAPEAFDGRAVDQRTGHEA